MLEFPCSLLGVVPLSKAASCCNPLGICCYRFPLAAYRATSWLWKKYPHSHSFSSFILMVTSSLVSFRDCPGMGNAACLLSLVEILDASASNASFGCNIPNTHGSLPSLMCLEMHFCCFPNHDSPPFKVLQAFIPCSFVAFFLLVNLFPSSLGLFPGISISHLRLPHFNTRNLCQTIAWLSTKPSTWHIILDDL